MKRYIDHHRRASTGMLWLCLILLGYVPIGYTEESTSSTTPAADPGAVKERAVSGLPTLPGTPPRPTGSSEIVIASLEKDLDMLERETRSAQARLAQPGTNAQEVASAAIPRLDVLTRSIAGKAATLQQIYAHAKDQRRHGAATSVKASADQMTQMIAASAVQSRSVSQSPGFFTTMLTNIMNMKHEMLKSVANNLRA